MEASTAIRSKEKPFENPGICIRAETPNMRFMLVVLLSSSGLVALARAQEQVPAPQSELAPSPTPLEWFFDAKTDQWTAPDGLRWKFDGMRWRLFWTDKKWYPVIPPAPFP